MQAREIVQKLAEKADIRINGDRPWDIQVHNDDLYARVLKQGTLGLGEAYMDGWWDCEAMDAMFCRALRARIEQAFTRTMPFRLTEAAQALFNLQSRARAFMVARAHYDTDPALFRTMLGPTMQYSCGRWEGVEAVGSVGLDEAQKQKMEMICRKLSLEPGMTVLDIGCGWGTLALHMAQEHGVQVTGITVSREQLNFAKDKAASSDADVEYRLMDYRSLRGEWDRVVSVGMFEHVGRRNYREFMDVVRNCLKPGGLFLLHSIGSNGAFGVGAGADPWLTHYIFPNGVLPSPSTLVDALDGISFWRTGRTSAWTTTRRSWRGMKTSNSVSATGPLPVRSGSTGCISIICCPVRERSGRGAYSSGSSCSVRKDCPEATAAARRARARKKNMPCLRMIRGRA